MRIAQVAPLFVRIPPERYGGTERVVQVLTEALVERGHGVSSLPPEEPEPRPCCTPRRLLRSGRWGISDALAYRVLQVEELVARSAEFDLIHSHLDYPPWIAGGRLRATVITTMHSRLDLPELRPLFSCMARSTTTASSGESCGVRPKRMSDRPPLA